MVDRQRGRAIETSKPRHSSEDSASGTVRFFRRKCVGNGYSTAQRVAITARGALRNETYSRRFYGLRFFPPTTCVSLLRKKSSTGRRRSSLTADHTSGRAGGSSGGDGLGAGGFGEENEEEECWHELKDEDGSGLKGGGDGVAEAARPVFFARKMLSVILWCPTTSESELKQIGLLSHREIRHAGQRPCSREILILVVASCSIDCLNITAGLTAERSGQRKISRFV